MSNSRSSQLGNKYVILDLIGAGGMSEVYRCKLLGRQGFEKIIVLKKLLSQMSEDQELVSNFIDEAKLAAHLEHENIAHIFDFGEIDGNYFMAMEYLFGKDLHTISQRAKAKAKTIGVENSLFIASKICQGMEYAHTLKDLKQRPLNIIHRDLSPHNVFVTYEGKVKIIDFGIAKAELFDNQTKIGVIKGKISYMSPEQLTDENIDFRSDIFSIGVLLYEMLSGKRMYVGDNATLIRKCMQVDYEKIDWIVPDLPSQVCDIVNKALQKDKRKRYQSCAEMLKDIDNCLYAMGHRPRTEILKEYVHQLFSQDYEAEKNTLLATAENFDENNGPGNDNDIQLVEKSYSGKYKPGLTIIHDTNDNTIVLSPGNRIGKSLNNVMESEPSFWSLSLLKKIVLGAAGTTCLAVIVFLAFYLDSRKVIPDIEPDSVAFVDQPITEYLEKIETEPVIAEPEPAPEIVVEDKPVLAISIEDVITKLLIKAEQAYEDKRFIEPEHHSALMYYTQVIEIMPENDIALAGLRAIENEYAQNIENQLQDRNILKVERLIEKGLLLFPQSTHLPEFLSVVQTEKKILIEELTIKAQRALSKNALTTPAGDCAYKYFVYILKLDKNNKAAARGMLKIGDTYAEWADYYFRNLNLTRTRKYVKKGLRVVPDHKHLLEIKKGLTKSKPSIFLNMVKKTFKPYYRSKLK